ncbi:methylenetetrahydrofolate dehydrogenase [Orientia tsutsugamushi str. Ikeda]|uniref:Bifunctional protein FolD n=1 Tax=Orientia tsutsugamushi (strain Ikeda) TaxID=334380 RepID=FOLD_ORITI|nr:bifunctional 5,10-methylenetetrahydrofolate dehydrogenase/5,10-methenyltetrahydrofolate cyclohydrolase [Orientia tsutsugamushi]B3CTT4.1 RecName: Full=Bifunctional protein FolD; Includes: RecName: Full=Methylenetetrahydrofolate dehydrogenase; Includes: RecName: Full=Methenyltetrahydrofolate cyclohydrolase [Orientia tsutsugamushi str. Ikeda]BAG40781.1 methylenetetrahydrofolate dehydrogenase [Orientia tsutsugamushi str. Ikeda]
MTVIMDGKKLAELRLVETKNDLLALKDKYQITVKLVIILVGNNDASLIYVNNKVAKAKAIGMDSEIIRLFEFIEEKKLLSVIDDLNCDSTVHGIIVQLPLPPHIDALKIFARIDSRKDVDGLNPINIGYLNIGANHGLIPCTALGCIDLLQYYVTDLKGKHVVVIGKSNIVGKPLSALLLRHSCTVTICHSATVDLALHTRTADIVISAVGKANFLTNKHFSGNLAFIDVGISHIYDLQTHKRKLVGDGDFLKIKDLVKFITPVPGGVGPMTVAYLLKNTLTAAKLIYASIIDNDDEKHLC